MLTDKQSLKDLEVFRTDDNSAALFSLTDKTKTAGGSYCLRQKFLNPPGTFEELKTEQEAIRFLSETAGASNAGLSFTGHRMKSLEEYISSNINVIENESLITCITFCLSDIEAYRYIKSGLNEITEFVHAFHRMMQVEGKPLPFLLKKTDDELLGLINDRDFREAAAGKDSKRRFWDILRSDKKLRTRLKKTLQDIIARYYEFDALISMAVTTVGNNFIFPEITDDKAPVFKVEGLYHPLLEGAVPYDIKLDGESNFVFLTGPNMAGKTTFLKAAGIALYLSHLGMGIPARSATISRFDRLLTSLNVTDSMSSGYSFFYSEVMRVKQLAEYLNAGEKTFSIFDELFRGTNVKDAFTASGMIISGLVRWKTGVFILSSHLWELWDNINKYSNITDLCFESEIRDGKPVFTYRLSRGVSDTRLGLTIIENEKIMELLNPTQNAEN